MINTYLCGSIRQFQKDRTRGKFAAGRIEKKAYILHSTFWRDQLTNWATDDGIRHLQLPIKISNYHTLKIQQKKMTEDLKKV